MRSIHDFIDVVQYRYVYQQKCCTSTTHNNCCFKTK